MSTTMTKQEIETKLTALVQQDELFKQDLINNPKVALERAGLDFISADAEIIIAETYSDQELSDDQLENVSGGEKPKYEISIKATSDGKVEATFSIKF